MLAFANLHYTQSTGDDDGNVIFIKTIFKLSNFNKNILYLIKSARVNNGDTTNKFES